MTDAFRGMPVIGDDNWQEFYDEPTGLSKGRSARPPDASLGGVAASFNIPLIPRAEWSDRIADLDRSKSSLKHIIDQIGVKVLDQNGTNYCWCNAVVYAVMAVRAVMNEPQIRLSPASVAAPIKGYRNQGGWGGEALDYIIEHGVASQQFWPANAIDRQYDNQASKADRVHHKVTAWLELANRSFNQLATCLLHRLPVPIGLNWWGHEVCAVQLVETSPGVFGVVIANSWGSSWGNAGFGVLTESKATPDDAVAPQVAIASTT